MKKDVDSFHLLQKQLAETYKTFVVDAFILHPDKKAILLQKRSADRRLFPNFWDAMGGHVDPGESLLEALVRETKEETTLQITEVIALVHQFEWPEDSSVINLQFLCRAEGSPTLEKGKVSEQRWIEESEICSLEPYLSSSLREGLRLAFAHIRKVK